MTTPNEMRPSEREQIATILLRRSNEIAGYYDEHREHHAHPDRKAFPASVGYALELEMKRLRHLAEKINPPKEEEEV